MARAARPGGKAGKVRPFQRSWSSSKAAFKRGGSEGARGVATQNAMNLAVALRGAGEFAQAAKVLEEALKLLEAAHPAQHHAPPTTAPMSATGATLALRPFAPPHETARLSLQVSLGAVQRELGNAEDAEAALSAAVERLDALAASAEAAHAQALQALPGTVAASDTLAHAHAYACEAARASVELGLAHGDQDEWE